MSVLRWRLISLPQRRRSCHTAITTWLSVSCDLRKQPFDDRFATGWCWSYHQDPSSNLGLYLGKMKGRQVMLLTCKEQICWLLALEVSLKVWYFQLRDIYPSARNDWWRVYAKSDLCRFSSQAVWRCKAGGDWESGGADDGRRHRATWFREDLWRGLPDGQIRSQLSSLS